jgi:pimeloyl-ACP methyl ester carboxylesterase
LPHLAEHVTCHLIDLPSAGDSRFDAVDTPLSVDQHIISVRRVIDALGVDRIALVGHDSGGLIARHAAVGDGRVSALGLINTEPSQTVSWRFRAFLASRNLPGFGPALGWLAGKPKLRRNGFVLGDAFADRSLLDGEFDEFFLRPLNRDRARLDAAIRVLRSFDIARHVETLGDIHARLDMPVHLVWGDQDPFFPLPTAREEVATFPNASLSVIPGAGLFSHEERPADVAAALLPTLLRAA